MLTYSISLNAVTVLPLKKIVSAEIAKFFWNAPFKSEELSAIYQDIERKWEVRLANHREKTIGTSNAFIEKNKLPPLFKAILKESIFSLYHAYRQMLLWKITYDPDDNIDLLKEEDGLYAPNYFADGEFNDFIWAKHLVINSNYTLNHRFNLACLYWFENETLTIWPELKGSGIAPLERALDDFLPEMNSLIALRIFQLEHKVDELVKARPYAGDFWQVGFRYAAEHGYEHATYHFWQKISESMKIGIVQFDSFFLLMSEFIDYPRDKISHFLYSQLPKERKASLLDWTIKQKKPEKWLTLLLSRYTQVIQCEIIEFVYQLPIKLYSDLLLSLAFRIKHLKLPSDSEIFHMLLRNLSPEEKHVILKEKNSIIPCLVKGKSFYNLGYIIKHFSLDQKEKCLFNGLYGSSINCLDILSEEGEFDLLRKFLSFFLIDIDPLTQTETLRKDASLFLQKFIGASSFRIWCTRGISEPEEKEVKKQIDILQTSLSLLGELCDKVCKEVSIPRASASASIFKADPEVNKETDFTFSSSRHKYEETNPAKRICRSICDN